MIAKMLDCDVGSETERIYNRPPKAKVQRKWPLSEKEGNGGRLKCRDSEKESEDTLVVMK